VVNPASLKFKHATLAPLLAALQQAVMNQANEVQT